MPLLSGTAFRFCSPGLGMGTAFGNALARLLPPKFHGLGCEGLYSSSHFAMLADGELVGWLAHRAKVACPRYGKEVVGGGVIPALAYSMLQVFSCCARCKHLKIG